MKLPWGMVGGGEGSQIGPLHRIATGMDGTFALVAGALDADPVAARRFARELGIAADRAYGDWREMLRGEVRRPGRVELVTVATPNRTHFEIVKAFLEAGIHVLCEKPLTLVPEEARALEAIRAGSGLVGAVNFGYSGYPMIREARAMIASGELGRIRVVVCEFAHGHHADKADAENPRVRWRYDPAEVGVSAVCSDAGSHALHLACFATGQQIEAVSADFVSCIDSRDLEDDALVAFRMSDGAVGRLWSSAVAVGRQHGLALQVFGERGGLAWCQERPEQLRWTPLNHRTRIIERGEPALSREARRGSRIAIGHPEGLPGAFANIYSDIREAIVARKRGQETPVDCLFPSFADGAHLVAAIHAAAESARDGGAWKHLP